MTSVVIWRERERIDLDHEGWVPSTWVGDIWIAADSRISKPLNSGERVIPTEAAFKILPINIKFYQEYENGPGATPVYEAQLTYAYAGNVLPATMTYGMLVSYLRGLTGPFGARLPTIGEIVGMVNRIGSTYAQETRQSFEAFVVGLCPFHHSNRRDHPYRLRFDCSGRAIEPKLLDLEPDGAFELLGSFKKEMRDIISSGFENKINYNPEIAVKNMIENEISGDIGGYLQLARIRNGVEIYPSWRGDRSVLPSPYSDSKIGYLGDWRANGIFGVS